MNLKNVLSVGVVLLLVSSSCKDSKKEDPNPGVRVAVVTAITDNVIIKNYSVLQLKSDSLVLATNAFVANPTDETLEALKIQWKSVALGWEACAQFQFGPAESTLPLDDEIGTWPINTGLIDNEIASNTLLGDDFVANTGSTRKGIYAMEYLLFANSTTVLSGFTTDNKASVRAKYLQLLASEISKNAGLVHQAWIGGYRDTFLKADGLDEGSSFSIIINSMVQYLEVVINLEIGNPIGKKNSTDNGNLRPTQVKAWYSSASIPVALAGVGSIKAVFTADNQGLTGDGIDHYVSFLKINTDGTPLDQEINTQLEAFRAAIAAIPDPLQTSVTTNTADINTAWKEGKKLLVLMKNDLPVNIGVQINFNSNDGD